MVLLGFGVYRMLTSNRVVFLEADFFSRVLRVLGGVVGTVTTELAHETNQLSLCILLWQADESGTARALFFVFSLGDKGEVPLS